MIVTIFLGRNFLSVSKTGYDEALLGTAAGSWALADDHQEPRAMSLER
jgi:hypothetical protein